MLAQLKKGGQTILEGLLLALPLSDEAIHFTNKLFQLPSLLFQHGNLGRVVPAQHVAAAVIDPVPVVLFVALARHLNLAGPGDGPGLAPKLVLGVTAGHVEAFGDLPFQPVVISRIGFDGDPTAQGIGPQGRRGSLTRRAHAEIDQAPLEVRFVHPGGHPGVVRVRHQQRQTEIPHQALDGPLPVALLLAHLDQLTGKGHVVFGKIEGAADHAAHGHLLFVNVATPGLEAGDFRLQLLVLAALLG